jgi:hypothetical protein
MKPLILKKSGSHYRDGPWTVDDDDYVVLNNERKVIGRIMMHPQAPQEQPWFWTITTREYPPSVYNRGYSASRELAMQDFKSRWLNSSPASFANQSDSTRRGRWRITEAHPAMESQQELNPRI